MTTVNTVLGPVSSADLGTVAVHEALLSVLPGAQYAPDITFDRPEIFTTLQAKLEDFRSHGGGTFVDATGMFHGRDLPLLEALSKATGVHIIASTGQGPEELLGGYFLTPQTNPPTPWPAEKFADLFAKEVTEGMVMPRVERRAGAGLIVTAVTRAGRTATDESLLRGAARAAKETGAPMSFQYGDDALGDLEIVLSEGLDPARVLVGGCDRVGAPALEIARKGAYVGIDNVGTGSEGLLDDTARGELVSTLIAEGLGERIICSSNAIGVAKGLEPREVAYSAVAADFIPGLGLSGEDAQRILRDNPREFITVRENN
ncbi:phosphotriesterase [Corynebacterium hylobatis]|uniref:Phosphotriesterase n=1 Tax=Corynebacterium hylobatis TaxID=1859290 RepID=A0A430I0Y5_9CORY|nr:phosphotriesterase [Corynebacterium hylobatis]RSZ65515.1 phosphotriesterase [Corynebacterium hylobatis]